MHDFQLRYHTETGINLEHVIQFNMPFDQKVVMQGDVHKDERDVPVKFGIFLEVSCKAEDIDSAISSTIEMIDSLVSLLCLSHQTWAIPVKFISGIDVTPGLPYRTLIQHFPMPIYLMPGRKYKNDVFESVWNKIMEFDDGNMPWLMRATRWYRKATLESDTLDQFVNLWTGLEALNELVKNKYSLPKEKPIRPCKKCGAPVAMEPTLTGIEYLFEKVSSGEWITARKTRIGLMHGYKDISEIVKNARQAIPAMHRALLFGICDILGLPPEIQQKMMREPLMEFTSPTLRVQASLHNLPHERLVDYSVRPRLALDTSVIATKVEDGQRTEIRNLGLRLEGFKGTWTPVKAEVYGKELPKDLQMEFNLTPK